METASQVTGALLPNLLRTGDTRRRTAPRPRW